ncbi:unnamed protein product [Rotaria magnacalcarata]|uniref:Uncharacterized protein n=2 Tax=Rotaria magnacalcarata TaxID=392030 RepID=A0A815UAM3_9BILA|nr:unnamed protein product [Rotaria magnacalcarata]
MNSLDLLKPFKLSYKNQIVFLKEREKLFSSQSNPEQTSLSSSPTETSRLVIDEAPEDVTEDVTENESPDTVLESSTTTTTLSDNSVNEKPLPNPYILPNLPDPVLSAMQSKQMEKYPSRMQYTTIVNGILNYLGIDNDEKTASSWRESLISKYKRERQNYNDEKVVEMKLRYSREKSGRKIKQHPSTQMSARNSHIVSLLDDSPHTIQQIDEKIEIIKRNFQNGSLEDENFKQLWLETLDYRLDFIKNNTTADILKEFSMYSNPIMILTDVKALSGIDLENIAKDNINSLSNKICTENKFLADTSSIRCIKTLCGLLNDSWKHYIYFYPEKLASPQPSILIDDENIKVYVDWSYVCSCTSIDQSIAVLVGLYFLLNLKLDPHRTAIRFLYVYLMVDKGQQSNVIRRFCKEYNIQLPDKPVLKINYRQGIKSSNSVLDNDKTDHDDVLTVLQEENNNEQLPDNTQLTQCESVSSNQQSPAKRKIDEMNNLEPMSNENNPPCKRRGRPTRRKRS